MKKNQPSGKATKQQIRTRAPGGLSYPLLRCAADPLLRPFFGGRP